jgi:hypothetical protein
VVDETIFHGPRSRPETDALYEGSGIKRRGRAMTKTFRKFGLMTVFATSLLAMPTASQAFSSEAQQMCTGDAFRLCSSEIPDVSRITACMMKQRASLSAGCRMVMEKDVAHQSSKIAAQ